MVQQKRKSQLLSIGLCAMAFCSYHPQAMATGLATPTAVQQTGKITGTVTDAEGPVIGATVKVKNSSEAAVTDLDGKFSIKAQKGDVLVVTYIGYQEKEITVGSQSSYSIKLEEDNKTLNEVVVMGYGVQKKKLVTGATVEIKGDDVSKLNTTSALGALQSQSPGVNITAASGQPGNSFKIDIRGAGTNGDTTPLYIIDGVAGGDINALNPADIERIDVLKDAASCAIYGARAANGVIMVTTKQGKQGKVQVSYDGYVGWQNLYRMPKMLTAKEYMQVMDQLAFNNGNEPYDWSRFIDSDLLKAYQDGTNPGTNWLDELRNKNAVTTSHALNIAGGSELSKFSIGTGYQYQDGIFGGPVKSDFRRFTFRINSDHVLMKRGNLEVIKFGENLYYQHKENQGIKIGDQYNNDISNMLRANPCVPARDANGKYAMYDYLNNSGRDGWFAFSNYTGNPIAQMVYSDEGNNKAKSYNMNVVGYLEVQPIKDLKYRGQVSYKQFSSSYRSFAPKYKVNNTDVGHRTNDVTLQNSTVGWDWSVTNTLNYKFELKKNSFDVLAGTEYSREGNDMGQYMQGQATNNIFGDFNYAYLSNSASKAQASVLGYPIEDHSIMSFFGRINYDYNETYMASVIMRADGSSNFAKGHRWGTFPSFSVGWVVSNEKWMQRTASWLDFLKIRASWGQNGNENIQKFAYLSTFKYGNHEQYPFGTNKNTYTQGGASSRQANDDITWETSEQTDLGLDARFLNGRLSFTADWYNKKTKDLLISVPVSSVTGYTSKMANAGTVENKGVELALNWRDKVGDFSYGAGFNFAYNKNNVTKVNNDSHFIEGGYDLVNKSVGYIARMEEGHPIGYFYGFKTDGIIQNQADLDQYVKNNCGGDKMNSLQGNDLQPGDVKFVDTNHDGRIDDNDKTDLGNAHPDVTMGINLNMAWKGFDLSITGYAALGQQIARSYRRSVDGSYENYTNEVYDYWYGEGTSTRYPRLAYGSANANWKYMSDLYVDNGSYFRLQNLTLGYDVKRLWKSCPLQQLRVYFTAQNLFTITSYKGLDPECGAAIGSDSWVTGVDVGNYPQARTYMVGVNVKF